MRCPLCHQRKARRACPALGQTICAVCCGTKRLVEIQCTPDCVYLEAAGRHPAAAVKRRQEHDIGLLMTALGPLTPEQLRLSLVVQTVIGRFTPEGGLARLSDADVAEAVGALAATRETAARGVVYEHSCAAPVAEELRKALATVLAEVGQGAGARFDRELTIVLRGVERAARHTAGGLEEGDSPYLTLLARVLHEPPAPRRDDTGPDASRILITG